MHQNNPQCTTDCSVPSIQVMIQLLSSGALLNCKVIVKLESAAVGAVLQSPSLILRLAKAVHIKDASSHMARISQGNEDTHRHLMLKCCSLQFPQWTSDTTD